jgi:DNA-binding beta-propeller fold protein YncE
VASQEASPNGMFIKPDGTKLFLIGTSGDEVNEYDLSTAWDITTGTFSQNFSVSTQDSSPTALFFKSDGTKMFVLGRGGDDVNEYTLSTAWDISTASYSQNFAVSTQDTSPTGIFFKSDGTEMYVTGSSNDNVYQYNLTTGWDVSTASYDQAFSVFSQESTPDSVFFKPDGTKMFITGGSSDKILEYALTTAWDISTASYSGDSEAFAINKQDTSPKGVFFKTDGTKMYMVGTARDALYQYDLSTAWDVSTASYTYPANDFLYVGGQETSPSALFFKSDGTKLYVAGYSGDEVNEYNLSTAWNIGSASFSQNFSVSAKETSPQGVSFKSDGTKMYITGVSSDSIHEYHLSTAWDISSASFDSSFDLSTQDTTPNGHTWKPDGTKFYIAGSSAQKVHEYDVSTAWDVSTATFNQSFQDPASIRFLFIHGVAFKTDGTKMYVVGRATSTLYEYNLSTAWDISTATIVHGGFGYKFFAESMRNFFFKPDGTKFWSIDSTYDVIYGFQMSPR